MEVLKARLETMGIQKRIKMFDELWPPEQEDLEKEELRRLLEMEMKGPATPKNKGYRSV